MLPDPGLDFTRLRPDQPWSPAGWGGGGGGLYACLTPKYWFDRIARLPVEVDVASNSGTAEPPISDRIDAPCLSASRAKPPIHSQKPCAIAPGKADLIASVLSYESSIARESNLALPIHAA